MRPQCAWTKPRQRPAARGGRTHVSSPCRLRLFVPPCLSVTSVSSARSNHETRPSHLRRPLRSDDRRSHPPRRHRPHRPHRARPHDLRRRGEVRRRQGDPRRHGTVADGDACRRSARPRHHQRRRDRRRRHLQGRRRHSRRPHRRDRQGGQPGHHGRRHAGLEIGASTEILAGEGQILTAGGIDAHVHFISPNQIPDAFHSGITTLIGGGTGPATGTNATTCTPGAWHLRRMYEAVAGVSAELRVPRQGQRVDARAAARADSRRRDRPEAARGLGHDAGGDRHVPGRGRRVRRPGGDSHRHAERSRVRRRHDRRHRRPDDSHLPHRRRRRRPCARHHPPVRRAQRAPLVDQPDDAVHEEYAGRASRHADGLPSPVAEGARGRRVRRLAHPARDDRRRGRAARSRRDQHDVVRLAGDGPDRRSDLPHLADGRQDEAAARAARRRFRASTTTCACAATSRSTRSTRRSPTASRPKSVRSRSGSWPTWCCGSRRSSASSRS